jgi:hypothetical protein
MTYYLMLVHHAHFNDMNITDKLNDEMRVTSGWGQVLYIDWIR